MPWRRPPRVEDDAALPKTDAAGRPFTDEHQAARYALSRDALKAREARRAADSIEVDAVEERAPDDAYVNDEAPRVYLMVDDRGKAAKLMALLNDEKTCRAYFPGLTHAGAVCAPRAASEKRAKGCRRTAWVALRNASLGAVKSAIDESPAPVETHLVQRALCGDVDVSRSAADDGAVAAVVVELCRRGGPLKVAVRANPRALEKRIVRALPAWCALEPQAYDLAVHAFSDATLGTRIALVPKTEEWLATKDADKNEFTRAAGKLREILDCRMVEFPPDSYVVDVGAAPGGWTFELARRGIRVAAVDPAELRDDVAKHPLVTHFRQKCEDFSCDEALGGLVCDINSAPSTLLEILEPLVRKLAKGAFIVLTLKFGGRGHDGESDRRKRIAAAEVLRDLQEIAPLASSRFCWLVANTDRERTLVARLE